MLVANAARAELTIAQATAPPAVTAEPVEPAEPMEEAEPAEEAETGPRVMLRIDRPTAQLQQQTSLGWRNVCVRPCGAFVDPSALYRVAGGGAVASEPFELPRASGDVFVDGK